MPPKSQAVLEDKAPSTSKKLPEASLAKKQSTQKKKKITPPALPDHYVSPAKKRRQDLDQTTKLEIGTIQGGKDYIERGAPQNEKPTFYYLFLWKSHHKHNAGRTSWRLHMYDAASDTPLEELHAIYRDVYDDDRANVDRDLATVSIWDDWNGVTNCPQPGDVVKFKRFTGLQMYHGDCLQFSTRPNDMEF